MRCKQNGTPRKTVILFTRYPREGKVKTRLIERLGPKGAADLHDRLTKQVICNIEPALRTGRIQLQVSYCGGSEEEIRSWLGNDIHPAHRQGHDLGERMQHAFEESWRNGVERVLIIGSDCPEIDTALINSGFKKLHSHDLVLGPAADGGYYLIGLRAAVHGVKPHELLFQHIDWGSGQVLRQTLRQAKKADLSFTLLPELHDIDRPEDLVHLNYYTDPE